nr:MAG TPA: hypothetical protein [Bacteriophage sp.]
MYITLPYRKAENIVIKLVVMYPMHFHTTLNIFQCLLSNLLL